MLKKYFNEKSPPLKWEEVLPMVELPLQPVLPDAPPRGWHQDYIENDPENVDKMGTDWGTGTSSRKKNADRGGHKPN